MLPSRSEYCGRTNRQEQFPPSPSPYSTLPPVNSSSIKLFFSSMLFLSREHASTVHHLYVPERNTLRSTEYVVVLNFKTALTPNEAVGYADWSVLNLIRKLLSWCFRASLAQGSNIPRGPLSNGLFQGVGNGSSYLIVPS